jgi:hypothetical protein
VEAPTYAAYEDETRDVPPLLTSETGEGGRCAAPLLLPPLLARRSSSHGNTAPAARQRSCLEARQAQPSHPASAHANRPHPYPAPGCLQSSSKRGAATVLGTLVSSARAVFRVLAEHQLADPGAGGASQGLLFRMCRERFILNSEQVGACTPVYVCVCVIGRLCGGRQGDAGGGGS